ncbi:thiolase family protein [Nocardia sp. FBN12]|uniref:thiolase family protein n=1 Tax=Nocardia sp. FBN12 TaxID=3419766 RepID=UPI003D0463A9
MTGTLAELRTSFREPGTITAGNASPLSDGASAVLPGSAAAADRLGRTPLTRIASRGAHAVEPHRFGYAPVEAAEKALVRAGIRWGVAAICIGVGQGLAAVLENEETA